MSLDPDGGVALDFRDAEDNMLSISISAEGRVCYAYRIGKAHNHGNGLLYDTPDLYEALRNFVPKEGEIK